MVRYHVAAVAIFDRDVEADNLAEAQRLVTDGLAGVLRPIGRMPTYLGSLIEPEGKERHNLERYLDRNTVS
jgi:hypothetical protein